jgi:hypothetical protein
MSPEEMSSPALGMQMMQAAMNPKAAACRRRVDERPGSAAGLFAHAQHAGSKASQSWSPGSSRCSSR